MLLVLNLNPSQVIYNLALFQGCGGAASRKEKKIYDHIIS